MSSFLMELELFRILSPNQILYLNAILLLYIYVASAYKSLLAFAEFVIIVISFDPLIPS